MIRRRIIDQTDPVNGRGHTVIVPPNAIVNVLQSLIENECAFSARPSPMPRSKTWHLIVSAEGAAAVNEAFEGKALTVRIAEPPGEPS